MFGMWSPCLFWCLIRRNQLRINDQNMSGATFFRQSSLVLQVHNEVQDKQTTSNKAQEYNKRLEFKIFTET